MFCFIIETILWRLVYRLHGEPQNFLPRAAVFPFVSFVLSYTFLSLLNVLPSLSQVKVKSQTACNV